MRNRFMYIKFKIIKCIFLLFIICFNSNFIWAQKQDNLFHDAAFFNTIEWGKEEHPYITPQAWFYIKDFYVEARYNYEYEKTGSLYFGRSFTCKKKVDAEIIPMIGLVYGETKGISPGFNFKLDYKKNSTSTQCQYTFDLNDDNNSFFWDWTTAYIRINEHFGIGSAFRVLIPKSGNNDIKIGPMLRYEIKSCILEACAFNLWQKHPVWSIDFEYDFDGK